MNEENAMNEFFGTLNDEVQNISNILSDTNTNENEINKSWNECENDADKTNETERNTELTKQVLLTGLNHENTVVAENDLVNRADCVSNEQVVVVNSANNNIQIDVSVANDSNKESLTQDEVLFIRELQNEDENAPLLINIQSEIRMEKPPLKIVQTMVRSPKRLKPGVSRNLDSLSRGRLPSYIEEPLSLTYSVEKLEIELEKTIKKKTIPPSDMCREVIAIAHEKNIDAIEAEDYDRAAAIDRAIQLITSALQADKSSSNQSLLTQSMKNRLDQIDKRAKSIEDEYNRKIEQHKEDEQKRREQIESEHAQQQLEFESLWSSSEHMQQFSKPSLKLLQMRRQQKHLALNHEFELAKHLKAEADLLQAKETEEAKKRAADAMRSAYCVLLEKQARELECFEKNSDRKLQIITSEKERELNSIENSRKGLVNRMNDKKRSVVLVPHVGEPRLHMTRTRTASRISRNNNEIQKLDVKITDFKSIVKSRTATPRISK